jgi:hypothetical protein
MALDTDCCYAECRKYTLNAECRYAERHYVERHHAERHYAEHHYAECYYAECHYAECRYAERRGAILGESSKILFKQSSLCIIQFLVVPSYFK